MDLWPAAGGRRTSSVRCQYALSVVALVLGALCGCGGGGTQKVVYAVGLGGPNVALFTVSSSGELLVAGSVSTGSAPDAIGIDPQLRFAYIVDSACSLLNRSACSSGPGGVSQYTLTASSGALAVATLPASNGTTPPSTPVPTGVNPAAIAIDSTGTFAFVANQGSNTISVYTIDPTGGALTEIKGSPFTTAPATGPVALAVSGKVLFVANQGAMPGAGLISAYTFDSTGTLTAAGTSQGVATLTSPRALALDSSGKFLYVADAGANNVAAFGITGNSGQLSAVANSPFAAGTAPVSVRVHPSGKFLYTANQGSNDVSAFSVDSSSGAMTPLSGSPVAVGPSPSYIATDTAGGFLFVANRDSNTISVFSIDSSGALKQATGSPFASVVINPVALASIN